MRVAKAAWFPTFSLKANGGCAASEVQDVFKLSTQAWGVGALLSLPLFDGGRREAGVQGANADLSIAKVSCREPVLVAFRAVQGQLVALRLLADQSEAPSCSVAASSRATVLSGSRYRNGLVSQLALLDAQGSELRNRRQALQVKAAQYMATVGQIRVRWVGAGFKTSLRSRGCNALLPTASSVVAVHQAHPFLRTRVVPRKRFAGAGVAKIPVLLHVPHKNRVAGRRFQANTVLAPGQDLA